MLVGCAIAGVTPAIRSSSWSRSFKSEREAKALLALAGASKADRRCRSQNESPGQGGSTGALLTQGRRSADKITSADFSTTPLRHETLPGDKKFIMELLKDDLDALRARMKRRHPPH